MYPYTENLYWKIVEIHSFDQVMNLNVCLNSDCWFDLSHIESLSLWNQIPASIRLFEWEGDYPFNLLIMHTVYKVGPVPKPLPWSDVS